MSRRDTILFAVMVNVALVALLLLTATIEKPSFTQTPLAQEAVVEPAPVVVVPTEVPLIVQAPPPQEIVLKEQLIVATPTLAIAPPALPPVPASDEDYYVIKSGDTPWSVAQKHKLALNKLLEMNNLSEKAARKLKIGDRLRVR